MSITFTGQDGSRYNVPKEEAKVVSNSGNQTVYAYSNPGGETMMAVRYNPNVGGMDMGGTTPDITLEEDLKDMIVGGNLEDSETWENPGKLFTWKNLRLQSAIAGEQAVKGKIGKLARGIKAPIGLTKRFFRREIPVSQSIRDSPNLMKLATTEDWYTYFKNMSDNPVDMGAELSALVTPSQKIAVAKFVAEWERDPGQSSLRKKAVPGADVNEIIAKGELVYNLITGRGPNPLTARGYGTFQYDKMFRLAYDIINSLAIYSYNSYTLYKMLDDEGETAYREAVDTYVPLTISEVGMVIEIQDKIAEIGPGYANMVVNDVGAAAEASTLMQKAVSAYSTGDTSRVRSILNYLQEPPFYYASPAAGAKNVFESKEAQNIVGFAVKIDKAKKADLEEFYRNGQIYISAPGWSSNDMKADGTPLDKNTIKNKQFTVHKSVFDDTPVGVLKFGDRSENFTFIKGAKLDTRKSNQQKKDRVSDLVEVMEAKGNPPPKGRGKFFFIQIHPKAQLKMKMAKTTTSGTGDLRHGDSKSKKGQNYWMKGLYTILNDMIKKDNAKYEKGKTGKEVPLMKKAVQVGTLKRTGEEAPYMIRLPKHYFKKANMHGVASIIPKKALANTKFVKAYQDFVDYYGLPKHSPSKGVHFRFIISTKHRGTYYDELRRKVGKAKNGKVKRNVADIGLHEKYLQDEKYFPKHLIDDAFDELEGWYEQKLKHLFNGNYSSEPYYRYAANQIENELRDDETLLDKLTLHLLDYYTWDNPKHLTQWSEGVDSENSESLKEDTLAFFEEHLSQKKYIDKVKEHVEYYADDMYGV